MFMIVKNFTEIAFSLLQVYPRNYVYYFKTTYIKVHFRQIRKTYKSASKAHKHVKFTAIALMGSKASL